MPADRKPPGGPRVSVVVPTYNRAKLLPEAIESVLGQTVDCWELIVVDDGSTDGTADVVKPYLADPRVRYRRRQNGGRSVARNDGVSLAQGELVSFFDSDDRYLPRFVESHLGVFAVHPGLGLSMGGYEVMDGKGAPLGRVRRPWSDGDSFDFEGWLLTGQAFLGAAVFRREWLERVGGFDPAVDGGEDIDLYLRLTQAGCPMTWLREIVMQNRRHTGKTDFRLQQAGHHGALAKLFDDPSLPAAVAALEDRAYARVDLYAAERAAAAGDDNMVQDNLRRIAALKVEPEWRREGTLVYPTGFPRLLAGLARDLAARCAEKGDDVDVELARVAEAWAVAPRDLRRARAQSEISAFFDCLEQGDTPAAGRHLWIALRLDPRWLAYRRVLTFPLCLAHDRLLRA